ncbi:hypothetical protein [Arvimicrobium flavum]|uniref:hypothetical protein n=1 Tax=Arvimicrobium flavum TaxID=3393320 RepID=UPI00237B7C92|nr:hypothetical protein [Mesorhizobium shangrilense]
MADFVAVLRKTLDGLGEPTPEMRERVYDKARATVSAKLAAINPAPPPAVAERQTKALEDAIAMVESEYAPAKPAFDDPLEELENVFAALKEGKPIAPAKAPARTLATPTVPKAAALEEAPAAAEPVPVDAKPEEDMASPQLRGPSTDFQIREEPPLVDDEPPLRMEAPPAINDDADVFLADDRPFEDDVSIPPHKRSYRGAIAAVVALLIAAGAGYGIWSNRDGLSDMLGFNGAPSSPEVPAADQPETPASQETDVAEAPPAEAPQPNGQPASQDEPKFTQRLNADGTEIDGGPAGGEQTYGEGTSVAALTAPVAADQQATTPAVGVSDETAPTQPVDSPAPGAVPPSADGATPGAVAGMPATGTTPPSGDTASSSLAVGQRAIFYEERTNVAQGSAEPGTIVWSEVQESPGGDLPPEPAIRAEATIPGKEIQLRMTIRRNGDKTLPASHIIEMIFLTPDNFEGGGIDNVLRIALKGSEQDAGSPLIGIPAKIADGFFLVALNDNKNEMATNLGLLQRQSWIDIPIVYKNGRRALFTMEKGIPGEKVFDATLKAWEPKTAG